jgi:uncharacterized repeat protein (TIGR02543 family)
MLADPGTRAGYTFTGWSPSNSIPSGSTGDKTFTAQWTANTYTLYFDANGGTVDPSDKTVTYDLPVGELPVPTTRNGYTFTGWNTAQDGAGSAYTSATVYTQTDNTTLYAQWSLTIYTITYENLNGAGNSNPASYTIESETITLADPGTRAGYTFTEWSPSNSIPSGSTGNKTFTAQWTVNTYTLYFDANGGTVSPSDKTVTYDLPVGELPVPTHNGYTFTGWNTAQDGAGSAYISATVYTQTGNLTLYAQWTSNSGIEDVESVAVSLYPNPAKNDLYIQSDFPIERVELYSQTGVLVKIETDVTEKIDVSPLVEGLYLARIYSGNQVILRKVIVKK